MDIEKHHPAPERLKSESFVGKVLAAMSRSKVATAIAQPHGLWFEVLSDEHGIAYTRERTLSFKTLYGYGPSDQFPSNPLHLVTKDYRRRVMQTLVSAQAPEAKGQTFDCTFLANAKDRRSIWIHALAQRVQVQMDDVVEGGVVHVLASLHSDVTHEMTTPGDLRKLRRFYEEILDTVPGFVFVKEVVSNSRIEFRYVNRELAGRLLKKHPDDVSPSDRGSIIGQQDRDYNTNEHQVRRFEEADRKVHEKRQPEFLPEETFGPKGAEIRLATVKVPFYTSYWSKDGEHRWYVLGVAVDITHITELLRRVVAGSEDGIYVKSASGRYVLHNAAFARLLGMQETDNLEGQTFADVVRRNPSYSTRKEQFEALIKEIEAEDAGAESASRNRLLAAGAEGNGPSSQTLGPESLKVRRAILSDMRSWNTRKEFIRHPTSDRGVILGITQDVLQLARIERLIVERMDLCACVKNELGEIIWCNVAYARQHETESCESLLGKTDADLWTPDQYPGQARKYMQDDGAVIRIAMAAEGLRRCGDEEAARELEEKLLPYRRIFEDQMTQSGRILNLLTEKWAVKIYGKWHVVVVYSNVTELMHDLASFQEFAFHCLKTDLTITSKAEFRISELIAQLEDESRTATTAQIVRVLAQARNDLNLGFQRLSFHTDHLVEISRGQLSNRSFSHVNFLDIVRAEIPVSKEIYGDILEIESLWKDCGSSGTVNGSAALLQAMIQEILRNSYKRIAYRRSLYQDGVSSVVDHEGVRVRVPPFEFGTGRIVVSVSLIPSQTAFETPRYCIEVADNGIAACCSESFQDFESAVTKPLAPLMRERVQRGLSFIRWTVAMHSGTLFVRHGLVEHSAGTETMAILQLLVPCAPPG